MSQKFNHIICHYGEIGLKGKNRSFFEKKLVENIKKSLELGGVDFEFVKRIPGRVLVGMNGVGEDAVNVLSNVFGVVNFSPAVETGRDIDGICDIALSLAKEEDFESFRVSTKRSDKSYPMNSQEVNEKVGAEVVSRMGKQVDLDDPDLTIYVEIVSSKGGDGGVFVFKDKMDGPGGLPVGTAGKGLVLMSGGIDSPVAAYFAAKRGIRPVFVHFHSYPHTSRESIEKVKELVRILNKYNTESKLYLVPFADIQKSIIPDISERYRIIFYRRFMVRIANEIARRENAKALITGESVAQVSSQTLENMRVISDVADLPVLRPLVGFDKEEIIEYAKRIGTFETSIRLADDTCTQFMPQSPATKARIEDIRKEESNLDVDSLVRKGVDEAEVELVQDLQEKI